MTASNESVLMEIRTHTDLLPVFWSAVALSSPGPDGQGGDLALARQQYGDHWEIIRRLTLLHVAVVNGVDDWGRIGLEAEAAVKVRVLLQEADEQALNPALGWPPFIDGVAQTPIDMLALGVLLADHLGDPPEPADFTPRIPAFDWVKALPAMVGAEPADPGDAVVALAADRRDYLRTLNAIVERWVDTGPTASPSPALWETLGDDGLKHCFESQGESIWALSPRLIDEFRGAVRRARTIGSPELLGDVQWLAAMRLALRGQLALFSAERMADLRPWSHGVALEWLRQFLAEE